MNENERWLNIIKLLVGKAPVMEELTKEIEQLSPEEKEKLEQSSRNIWNVVKKRIEQDKNP